MRTGRKWPLGVRTKVERLAFLLEQQGYADVHVRPATGYWKHKVRDCYVWEATATRNGLSCSIDSYDTVTACVRWGFDLEADPRGPNTIMEAHARAPGKGLGIPSGG